MPQQEIIIEPVIFTDQSHLSQWYMIRSESSVRYGCRSVKKITPEQHRRWWQQSMTDIGRLLFFIREYKDQTEPGRTVGILRLDDRDGWMEVWLAIKPSDRNRKIATIALAQICERAWKMKWPQLGAIVSGQKNHASWKLFTRAGFIPAADGFIKLVQKPRSR